MYALMGLCPVYEKLDDGGYNDIRYTRSATDTYKLFARLIMERESCLHYMLLAGELDRLDDLPSWVPDLRAARYPIPLLIKEDIEVGWDANDVLEDLDDSSDMELFEISADQKELIATGLILDEIAELSAHNNLDEDTVEIDASYVKQCMEMAGNLRAKYQPAHIIDRPDLHDASWDHDSCNYDCWHSDDQINARGEAFFTTMLANSIELSTTLDYHEVDRCIEKENDKDRMEIKFTDEEYEAMNEEERDALHVRISRMHRVNAERLAVNRVNFLLQCVELGPDQPRSEVGGGDNDNTKIRMRRKILRTLEMVHKYRRFMTTKIGVMGIVPASAEAGDIICQLNFCGPAVVLRRVEKLHGGDSDHKYKFIGAW